MISFRFLLQRELDRPLAQPKDCFNLIQPQSHENRPFIPNSFRHESLPPCH
jgi:hypothetical protein